MLPPPLRDSECTQCTRSSLAVVPKRRKRFNLVFPRCFPYFLNHRTFPGVGERGHEKVSILDAQVNAKTQSCYHPQDLRAGSGHCARLPQTPAGTDQSWHRVFHNQTAQNWKVQAQLFSDVSLDFPALTWVSRLHNKPQLSPVLLKPGGAMVDTDGGGRHLWAEATQVGALGNPTVHQPSPLLRCLYTRKERGKGVGRENQDKKDAESGGLGK